MHLSEVAISNMVEVLRRVGSDSAVGKRLLELQQLENEMRELVEVDVRAWFETFPGETRTAASHLFAAGGKRLRPVLAMVAAAAAGGTTKAGLPVAAAVELLHTGTLLHDDVVDEGDVRRGRATARAVWGNALAVLSGDFCYFAALDALLEHGDHEVLKRAMKVARALAEGELIQLRRRGTSSATGQAEYYEIIEKKTGALFAFSTFGGAACASAPATVRDALDEYGRLLGLAFQIMDDVLDFSADADEFGKTIGKDVIEGTITLPLVFAMEENPEILRFSTDMIERFATVDDADSERAAAAKLVAMVKETGGVDRARAQARVLTLQAIDQLTHVPDNEYTRALETLAVAMMERGA